MDTLWRTRANCNWIKDTDTRSGFFRYSSFMGSLRLFLAVLFCSVLLSFFFLSFFLDSSSFFSSSSSSSFFFFFLLSSSSFFFFLLLSSSSFSLLFLFFFFFLSFFLLPHKWYPFSVLCLAEEHKRQQRLGLGAKFLSHTQAQTLEKSVIDDRIKAKVRSSFRIFCREEFSKKSGLQNWEGRGAAPWRLIVLLNQKKTNKKNNF